MRFQALERHANNVQMPVARRKEDVEQVILGGKSTEEEIRAIMQMEINYIDNKSFRHKHAEKTILQPMPLSEDVLVPEEAPLGLHPYIASLYRIPLLTKEQEVHQFRAMNFLKFRASALQKKLPRSTNGTTTELLERIPADLERAQEVRNHLIQSNLRLVVPLAKHFTNDHHDLHEMIILGNDSLMNAVDKFDYGRGYKFSTYATRAIMCNFPRAIHKDYGQDWKFQASRLCADDDSTLTNIEPVDTRSDALAPERMRMRHHSLIRALLAHLDKRECAILMARYGIRADMDEVAEPLSLEQTGHMFHITRERIRQIEEKAMVRLRKVLKNDDLDALTESTQPLCISEEQKRYFFTDQEKIQIEPTEATIPFEIIRS